MQPLCNINIFSHLNKTIEMKVAYKILWFIFLYIKKKIK